MVPREGVRWNTAERQPQLHAGFAEIVSDDFRKR